MVADNKASVNGEWSKWIGDIKGNLELAINAIEGLFSAHGKHDIYLFTEMFITGYPPEDLILRDDLLNSAYDAIKELSLLKPESYIVIGYPKKEGDSVYNCAGVLHDNSIILEYRKQELPNYEVFDEKRYFVPGTDSGIFEVIQTKVALTVCEDIWHNKSIDQAFEGGANLILNINASPFHLQKISERKDLISGHASKYNLPIIYANQVGGQDELVFDGTSMVMDSQGDQVMELSKFQADKKTIEFFSEDGIDLKVLNKEEIPAENEISDVYEALVLGARDYILKNNFPGVLIGSSGGIDSALTAAIAADAIGPEKVRTFMMPFKFTSEMSVEDANKLAENLGIKHAVLPIGDIYKSFCKELEEEFKGQDPDVTEENLQSRCRGVLLMALSNKSGEEELHVPFSSKGFSNQGATLNYKKINGNSKSLFVKSRRLDEYEFSNVGFIKIDVEGYEPNVIEGAMETIKRCRPVITMECFKDHAGNAMTIEELIIKYPITKKAQHFD